MNTKGTKFLAVLAVLAMAFAAFAVTAPAEQNDAVGAEYFSPEWTTGAADTTLLTGDVSDVTPDKYFTNDVLTVESTSGTTADEPVVIYAAFESTVNITAGTFIVFATVTVADEYYLSYAGTNMSFASATGVTITVGEYGDLSIAGDIVLSDGDKLVIPEGVTTAVVDDTSISVSDADAESASVVVKGNVNIADAKTLEIGEGINLTVNGKIVAGETGELSIAGGKLTLGTGGDISDANITGTINGEIRDKREFSSLIITGDTSFDSEYTYPSTQSITIAGTWTLLNGADITIKGELIINSGSKVVIEPGARLAIDNNANVYVYGSIVTEVSSSELNDGALLVESGCVNVFGTLKDNGFVGLQSSGTILTANLIAEDGGNITITKTGELTASENTDVTVSKDSVFLVQGLMDVDSITNKGTVTLASDVCGGANDMSTTIYQQNAAAVVDVQKVILAWNIGGTAHTNTITVNYGMTPMATLSSPTTAEDLSEDYAALFKGLVLGGTTVSNAYNMLVSGDLTVTPVYIGSDSEIANPVAKASVSLHGTTMVAADALLTMGKLVTLTNNGTMTVKGTVSALNETAMVNAGTITLADKGVIDNYTPLAGTVNGAKITIATNDIKYLTIDNALTMMYTDSSVEEILALGTTTVTANNYIAADTVLVVDAAAEMNIGTATNRGITLYVYEGGTIRGSGTVNVNASLYAEDQTDVKTSSLKVISDVKIVQTDDRGREVRDGWALWTNVITALASAEVGDTVVITKESGYVIIGSSMEIPAGVTLYVPEDKAPLKLMNGVTLTVNGVLITDEDIFAETIFDVTASNVNGEALGNKSSAIVVNNVMYMPDSFETYITPAAAVTELTASDQLSTGAPIAGAYYKTDDYSVISSLAFAVADVDEIIGDITINGAVSADTLTFIKGDEGCDTIVIGDAATTVLTVTSLTLDGTKVASTETAGLINGKIGNDAAALTLNKMTGTYEIKDSSDKLYIGGAAVAGTATVSEGTVYTSAGLSIAKLNVGAGATLNVANNAVVENMTVDGSLVVPNAKSLTATKLYVNGSVTVTPATTSSAAGSLQATNLYVGMNEKTITTGAAASVSGPITTPTSAFVFNGTSIDSTAQAVLDAMYITEFYVEGKLWFTAYKSDAGETVTVNVCTVENAFLDGWNFADGTEADDDYAVVVGKATAGSVVKVYAVIEYYIYNVYILTDNGIKSVAIDGKEMVHVANNTFAAYDDMSALEVKLGEKLKAGVHTVSYTTYSGYTGLVNLYTADNTILKDLKFTLSGTDSLNVTLQLYGTEQAITPEPEPVVESEWTITTILLLILVILIAIMAVIVAIRLNRS